MRAKLASLLLFFALSALAQAPKLPPLPCTNPLSEAALIGLVKTGAPARVGQLVAGCGIDFEPTGEAIARLRSAGASKTVLDAVRAATGPAERKRREEQSAWESIQNSRDWQKFDQFLRAYPAGLYAAEARSKLAALKPPMIALFVAEPASVRRGESSTLRWQVTGSTNSVSISHGVGDVPGAGTTRVQPYESTLYTLIATGPGGTTRAGATVGVTVPPQGGPSEVNPKDGLTYVWIPPGTFPMGCSPDDSECQPQEKPAHPVTITKGFWLGRSPVTQQAYERVRGQNPSHFKGADLPVESVNWDEANSYCAAVGGRLPTEAEWEYAARAGSTSARYGNIDDVAWYTANSGATTHRVEQKLPNAFGLYDVLGNVFQWIADWYGGYPSGAQSDPAGPGSGQLSPLRGGSWVHVAGNERASFRLAVAPSSRYSDAGLRCVWESPSPAPALSTQNLDDLNRRANAAYDRKDYAGAAPLYQQLADSGKTGPMNRLGLMYQNGQGEVKDYAQALGWYRKAADGGSAAAMDNLGVLYQNGWGVAQDYAQAATWYRKGADHGDAIAANNLGVLYQNGRGVSQDYAQAVVWYRKAADSGNAAGMNNLGWMYEKGYGVTQDYASALDWYRKAAALGNELAKANLARLGQSQ